VEDPLGVVLAGGLGRRIGGAKATVKLNGRPLISYPLDALGRVLGSVAVVAKRDSELPALAGVTIWIEPDEPRHPLAGIVHALRCAQGRPVLVCAVDLPLVGETLVRSITSAAAGSARAVVASAGGRLQPALGCYGPAALNPLASALASDDLMLSDAIRAIDPIVLEVANPEELLNVNTPEDLLEAAALLDDSRSQPNVKS
jgi:molybdopterin-guanine dinucleotide biosynthesis protein A